MFVYFLHGKKYRQMSKQGSLKSETQYRIYFIYPLCSQPDRLQREDIVRDLLPINENHFLPLYFMLISDLYIPSKIIGWIYEGYLFKHSEMAMYPYEWSPNVMIFFILMVFFVAECNPFSIIYIYIHYNKLNSAFNNKWGSDFI